MGVLRCLGNGMLTITLDRFCFGELQSPAKLFPQCFQLAGNVLALWGIPEHLETADFFGLDDSIRDLRLDGNNNFVAAGVASNADFGLHASRPTDCRIQVSETVAK